MPAGVGRQPAGSNNLGFSDTFGVDDVCNDSLLIERLIHNFFQDDAFGPFSDATANDPFTHSEQDDSPFDFGDFQAAETPSDGEMTPTAGSWTFEGGSSEGSSSLSGSTLSMGGSSEEMLELRESVEAFSLEDHGEEGAPPVDLHLRAPSIRQ